MKKARKPTTAEIHESRWADHGFDGITESERQFIGIYWLVAEVMNGGMHQFFWNSSGDLAEYACSGLQRIGATTTLRILEEAMALIPGGFSSDQEVRRSRMASIPNEVEAFDSVSRRLQDYPEDVKTRFLELLSNEYRRDGVVVE